MSKQAGSGFYSWNGKLLQSDIVYSCVRPYAAAIGKLLPKHIRETVRNGKTEFSENPEPFIKILLEEPNPYMSGQKLLERLGWQLKLNANAFAVVLRDEMGTPSAIYPLPGNSVETDMETEKGTLILWFSMPDGKRYAFYYSDIIHLRLNYDGQDEIFGTSPAAALAPLMEQVTVIDQGIIKAIKNSNVIQWLLKFNASIRPEDIQTHAEAFAESFMKIDGGSVGVAAVDTKTDAVQVDPKNYVPNAPQMDRTTQRIYSMLGTNEKITQNKYTEDEWNAYYEAEIEPAAIDLKNGFTTRIFSRRQRAHGNKIIFESTNLATASMKTKLALVAMVDRAAMSPNEWRKIMNMGPVKGGDKLIRRLDTIPVDGGEGR